MGFFGRLNFYRHLRIASNQWKHTGRNDGRDTEIDAAWKARFHAKAALEYVKGAPRKYVDKAKRICNDADTLYGYLDRRT